MSQSISMQSASPSVARDRTGTDEVAEAAPAEARRAGAAPAAPPAQRPPKARQRLARPILMLGGIAVVVVGSLLAWLNGGRYVSVDDAYVGAAKLLVSTDVSGIVERVEVREGQAVKAGDALFRLDPRQFRIALDKAEAKLAETRLALEAMRQDYRRIERDIAAQQAVVDQARAQFDRYSALVRTNNVSAAAYDEARFTLEAAESKLASLRQEAAVQLARLGGRADADIEQHPQFLQAEAEVAEARRQLDHTVVRAPFDGIVTQVDQLQPGQYLAANTAAFGLIGDDRVWVDANAKETDLTYVKPGDPVSIAVDTYPGHVWTGRVESISPASGATFSVLPAQNASGNWVKVVQRIPVRIAVERRPDDPPLRVGMSVVADIDTGHRRSLGDLF